jgi:hypothetical protein
MARNWAIDPELLRRARELSGERTTTAAVTKAPREFIARRTSAAWWNCWASWNDAGDHSAERPRRRCHHGVSKRTARQAGTARIPDARALRAPVAA